MDTVVFYFRNGCHLCEELAAVLFRHWPDTAGSMEWCDVDADPVWRERFGLRVPVLMQGENMICEFFPDLDRMCRYFGQMANPV